MYGFGSAKLWWEYAFEGTANIRKIDFLDNLKKITSHTNVYSFNFTWFNINYYGTPNKKKDVLIWKSIYENYKEHSSNINFKLEDLDYKNICKYIYNNVIKKYGNDKKYIVIGHSYSGPIALLCSKMYKNKCKLCVCIDNPLII
jgi:hypothetical protein